MDTTLIINIVELICAAGTGVLTAAASFWILGWVTSGLGSYDDLRANNVALAILFASIMVASTLVAVNSLNAMGNTLGVISAQGMDGSDWTQFVLYILLFGSLGVALSVGTVAIAARTIMWLTRGIDEAALIKDNNVAVATTLGAVIVAMGMFMAPAVQGLMTNLLPYNSQHGETMSEWSQMMESADSTPATQPEVAIEKPNTDTEASGEKTAEATEGTEADPNAEGAPEGTPPEAPQE